MEMLTPKKREIAAREEKILKLARSIIVRDGYHGLNMDRIAEGVSYSKGTIYNHFSCKEEIIIALAAKTAEKRVELFKRAAEFNGKSRFRLLAIALAAEMFVREFPDYFMFEEIIQLPSVREKTSQTRQSVIDGCELQCMSIVTGIVRDAIARKELILPKRVSPEELVFGFWSLTSGAYSITLRSQSLEQIGLTKPFETVRDHVSAMLDGYSWKPRAKSYDRDTILREIETSVLSDTSNNDRQKS